MFIKPKKPDSDTKRQVKRAVYTVLIAFAIGLLLFLFGLKLLGY